jgi:hypothetical protein
VGDVVISEGKHRAAGASAMSYVAPENGGIPEHRGYLEYEWDGEIVTEVPRKVSVIRVREREYPDLPPRAKKPRWKLLPFRK